MKEMSKLEMIAAACCIIVTLAYIAELRFSANRQVSFQEHILESYNNKVPDLPDAEVIEFPEV